MTLNGIMAVILRYSTDFGSFAEIVRVGGGCAFQGHSRSLMLVPIESLYATSYY